MFKYIDWPFAEYEELNDQIIYDYFKLTQEEIDLIEQSISKPSKTSNKKEENSRDIHTSSPCKRNTRSDTQIKLQA